MFGKPAGRKQREKRDRPEKDWDTLARIAKNALRRHPSTGIASKGSSRSKNQTAPERSPSPMVICLSSDPISEPISESAMTSPPSMISSRETDESTFGTPSLFTTDGRLSILGSRSDAIAGQHEIITEDVSDVIECLDTLEESLPSALVDAKLKSRRGA
ncbi:hypothetical protein FZEAL_10883 [Fusarium zealandicum]|uniref:Uncharacterized protein n=1 Tax=Fusarium zealandicum TaxID=1053134 RepID=A0A8H4TUH6_9HYPO|nr:hypothetical protein FZEAL_10883 [Fusarium zealandicum]